MIGLVDVGGGTRGIFGAGVLDYCMDAGIRFDFIAGVSAGSANGASYLAGQRGRNYVFYNEYAFRKEYMGVSNLIKTGSFLNLDYIYGTLSNEGGEYPLDYDAMMNNPADFEIVATDARTGKPVYFHKKDIRRNAYGFLKASCCVPVINRAYPVGEGLYYDGGMTDPIPWRRAVAAGCERIVVVLTRPKDMFRSTEKDARMSRLLKRRFPNAAKALAVRGEVYNGQLREILEEEKKGNILIVAPDSIGGLKTLSQDHEQLEGLYRKGYEGAKAIHGFLSC